MSHVSDEHRFVFLSVPYTKSTSTRRWLERKFGAIQYGGPHEMIVPSDEYLTWTIYRDPVDRAISLWRRIHRTPERRAYEAGEGQIPPTFLDFVRILASGRVIDYRGRGGPAQFWPQSRHLEGVKVDRFFRFEDVPEAYASLPFVDEVGDFPHLSRNGWKTGLSWDDIGSEKAMEYILSWESGVQCL